MKNSFYKKFLQKFDHASPSSVTHDHVFALKCHISSYENLKKNIQSFSTHLME